ncbi:hypothetical protein HKCCE2091_14090 [Rhodobacterales bacterium HKCCE2091]|nr:hypothetical protein [Rhodobacterales bacterium HKCCE2091]
MHLDLGMATSAVVLAVVSAAAADTLSCEGLPVSVTAPTRDLAHRTCAAAARTVPMMAECGVVLARPQAIEIADAISGPEGCIGIYHCGEATAEILTPGAIARVRRVDGAFHAVPTPEYFDSVVTHELAHGAYDTVACPFRSCVVTSEYVAYAMQVLTLPDPARAAFETGVALEDRVSRHDLTAIGLRLAPDHFVRTAWAHFSQREDGCAYVSGLMRGDLYLDRDRPDP